MKNVILVLAWLALILLQSNMLVGRVLKENKNLQYHLERDCYNDFILDRDMLSSRNFAYVQGGSFQMGSYNGDPDELPLHEVTLSSFLIARHEVTQGEYLAIMGFNPSICIGSLSLPVDNVCFNNAIEFCNKLSFSKSIPPCYEYVGFGFNPDEWPENWDLMENENIVCHWTNNGFRLPTEAEWEYAAKGGQFSEGYIYAGNNNLDLVGWYSNNSNGTSHQVCSKNPNELGLYDMSGNIWEIVWDYYGIYTESPQNNPTGPIYGVYKVFRGGMWYAAEGYSRISNRSIASSTSCASTYGFRIARRVNQ